jgi:hypothetical protein
LVGGARFRPVTVWVRVPPWTPHGRLTDMSTGPSARKRRTRAEMQRLDALIRPLYESGKGCRVIGAELGEDPVIVYRRVDAMGLARDKNQARQIAPMQAVPFQGEASEQNLRTAALGEAASWFLRRGYVASVPLAVAQYNLVVESDNGFMCVQVKSTTSKDRYGRWCVGIARLEYGATIELNANSVRKRRSYRSDEVDLFFIVTGDGDKYLIPLGVTGGATNLTLNEKYAAYKVA